MLLLLCTKYKFYIPNKHKQTQVICTYFKRTDDLHVAQNLTP